LGKKSDAAGMGSRSNIRHQRFGNGGQIVDTASARARRWLKNASRVLQIVAVSLDRLRG